DAERRAALRAILAKLESPCVVIPGNHDGETSAFYRDFVRPEPIVDVASAARAARDAIWTARAAPGYAGPAAGIVQRHASRADARFANDRAPRRRAASAQLTLDL
ncbi:MAG TPA: hypothetical protein PLM52_10490, partial [Tabrizicola sp.]|nr:hypothetical protein [Tabrizicola sp.]